MLCCKDPASILDQDFDKLYSEDIQSLSHIHWTPIAAVKTAIDFFSATLSPEAKILDVGSGVGKFCIFGSLISDFNFIGVEKRKNLFHISNKIALKMKKNNVSFICNDAIDLDWNIYDGAYIYNPFYEYKLFKNSGCHIDNNIEYSEEKYNFYITKINKKFRLLKKGFIIVVFNGYGGSIPEGFSEKFYKKINNINMSLCEKFI